MIGLLAITSCEKPQHQVTNTCPNPKFHSCKTADFVARSDVPDYVVDDLVQGAGVMLKLRERQDADERDELGNCPLDDPKQPKSTKIK